MNDKGFDWHRFDEETVSRLAEAVGFFPDQDTKTLREFITNRVPWPTPELVKEHKDLIIRTWLRKNPKLAGSIAADLSYAEDIRRKAPQTEQEVLAYLQESPNKPWIQWLIASEMLRFGGGAGQLPFFLRSIAVLNPNNQPGDPREPHDYQKEAWRSLTAHLAERGTTGVFQGLLVMPTGAGKTYTAVRWLLSNVVAKGGRVLWLAHRHELLEQAAHEFHKLAGLAQPRESLRVRVVSGAHCKASQIDPSDDVVVASVPSLAKNSAVRDEILSDQRIFVVIDEAHHAPAKSYRDIINFLRARKQFQILGLTATPTRTIDMERPILRDLFGGRILFQVEPKLLVERNVLSRPVPVHIKTNAHVEAGVTPEDLAHLNRFQDLSEAWLDRIAKIEDRNALIVKHYLDNKEKYGPTIVFAINVAHAALLARELRDKGIRAEYIASYRPDDTAFKNSLQEFRNGMIDVIVNVMMLTEGVDVPRASAVFLARPTSSEILLRQMIGRALRGTAMGGTDKAYLVSFEDHWDRFTEWMAPFDLVVPDVTTLAEPAEERPAEPAEEELTPEKLIDHLPWDLIRSAAATLRSLAQEEKADAYEAIPHGWYILERNVDEEGIHQIIPVYDHQRPFWDELIRRLEQAANTPDGWTPEAIRDDIFADCVGPNMFLPLRPSLHDIGLMLEHFRSGGNGPEYRELADRRTHDPWEVAQKIWKENIGAQSVGEFIKSRYDGLARAIYPDPREYEAAINDALYEIRNPGESTRRPPVIPVFNPLPDQQLAPGPAHNLDLMLTEVLFKGAEILGVDAPLSYEGTVRWSSYVLRRWYGYAEWRREDPVGRGRITLNRLLDSPDISRNAMLFLLWHEFLHIHLHQGHTPEFRELEHSWPNFPEWNRELDNLPERFALSER
jgi:superfamily II DNA or RNA helicase